MRPLRARLRLLLAAIDAEIARQRRRLVNLMRDLSDAGDEARAAIRMVEAEIVAAINEGEQQRANLEKQRVTGPSDAALATLKAFHARLQKGVENARTFADRREVVEAMNLTGTLLVKNGEVRLRVHWWGSEEDDEPICIDNGAAR